MEAEAPDDEENDFDLEYGAVDALGAVFLLRTKNYKLGKIERFMVYTSEKNWWLEAKPVAFEKVKVPAGTFDTVKLSLKTYIGRELQQKGDVIGVMDLTFNLEESDNIINDTVNNLVWQAVLVLLLIAIFMTWLIRKATRPIAVFQTGLESFFKYINKRKKRLVI